MKRPEADNLVGIYAALSDAHKADVLAQFGGAQFSGFKQNLADLAVAKLAPVAARMSRLLEDPGHIDQVLGAGAARAASIAGPVLEDVRRIVGFVQSRPR